MALPLLHKCSTTKLNPQPTDAKLLINDFLLVYIKPVAKVH